MERDNDLSEKLRQVIEKKFSEKNFKEYKNVSVNDVKGLVHELEVHQIELEMQNEELRNANSHAENAMAKYYELYDFAPSGYFTINEQGRILEVNRCGLEILNIKKCFLINNYFQNFITDDSLSIYKIFITKVFDTQVKQKCEVKLIKKNMTPFHVEIQGISVKNSKDDQMEIWISIFDITDRIKAIELEEAARELREEEANRRLNEIVNFDKLKTEFFSNQSHELRTPLNVILGTSQLIELQKQSLQDDTGVKLDKHISTIKQNCFRLLRLINNIMDITKIESNFSEIHLANENIVSIVEDITLSVAEYIENKGIFLQFDTEIEEKVIAYDADKIERIMLNLLSNAVKFTKAGGEIMVNIYDRDENIEISVRDTGAGIPKDKIDVIFKRFHQVDMSLTREYEGSGIGLSLVKALVEMQGGTISVESEYGKGSEFIIKLPIRIIPEEEVSNIGVETNFKQSSIERLNIEFSDIYLEKKTIC